MGLFDTFSELGAQASDLLGGAAEAAANLADPSQLVEAGTSAAEEATQTAAEAVTGVQDSIDQLNPFQ